MALSGIEYNTVYYWDGGTEVGEWRRTLGYSREILANVRRGGRVAHPGHTDVGAPEEPPRPEQIAAALAGKVAP